MARFGVGWGEVGRTRYRRDVALRAPVRLLGGPFPSWPGAPFLVATPLKGAEVRLDVWDSYRGHSLTPQIFLSVHGAPFTFQPQVR